MAQNGLHGIVGLALLQRGIVRPPRDVGRDEAGEFSFGFVAGNILPDADLIPLAFTFLVNPTLAMKMHRTFTHSLLTLGVVVGLGTLLAREKRKKLFWKGLGLGACFHYLLDVFIWFSGVDLLWPLGYAGLPSQVNLWAKVKVPDLVTNFLGAADFLAFGLFLLYLYNLGRSKETNIAFLPRLRIFAYAHLAAFAVYVALAGELSKGLFEIAQYAVFVLISFPIAVYSLVRSKETVAALTASAPPRRQGACYAPKKP